MPPNFVLREAIHSISDPDSYEIEDEADVENDPQRVLDSAVESIATGSEHIMDDQIFNTFQSLLKALPHLHLPPSLLLTLLDSLSTGLSQTVTTSSSNLSITAATASQAPRRGGRGRRGGRSQNDENDDDEDEEKEDGDGREGSGGAEDFREQLERYGFLIMWFVSAAVQSSGGAGGVAAAGKGEKGKKKAGKASQNPSSWSDAIPDLFSLISKTLRLPTERIWQTNSERDAFLSCFTRPANLIAQSEANMKVQDIKLGYYKVLCLAARNHGQAFSVQTTIAQNLNYFEHLAEPMAEMITVLAKEFEKPQIGEEVLRDIASKHFNAQDAQGPRSCSKFLVKLAELNPRMVLKQIAVLQRHLDSEFYPMRNALLEVLGVLIKHLSTVENSGEAEQDQEQQKKQLEGFFELIFERFADLSSYVRTKVVAICMKTLDLEAKFPKIRLEMTGLAIRSLEDKSSLVRKNCISLLIKLILTHPYGRMHGGELSMEEWRGRFEDACKELEPLIPAEVEARKMAEAMMNGEGEDENEEKGEEAEEGNKKEDGGKEGGEDEAEKQGKRESQKTPAAKKKDKMKTPKVKRENGEDDEGPKEDEDDEDDEEEGGEGEENGEEEKEEDDENEEGDESKTEANKTLDDEDSDESSSSSSSSSSNKKKQPAKQQPKKRKSEVLDLASIAENQVHLHLNQDKIMVLRLKKRYYSDALAFIEQLELAVPVLVQLLASKIKSEVVESIEFFKIASQYRLDVAELGVRRMLHLVWDKDTASTEEDGKVVKGVRSKLIDCYKELYFSPLPGASPQEQVNRITKNMIEQTFGATLAELTSLEQLMSIMMSEGPIHPDIIKRLWQVYGTAKTIPRAQRRGAIIILGMLAITKPEVVADKTDELMRIGLGPAGKSDLVLAKYSCIALRRVGGTFKKAKGTQVDKSVRFPMENPVFEHLKQLVTCETHDQEWFAMAEQGINTIYTLGEQPDALCSNIIHELTLRTFRRPAEGEEDPVPDGDMPVQDAEDLEDDVATTAPFPTQATQNGTSDLPYSKHIVDAFKLAQLIFVAGHCAMKQIVHLEIVEREFKRRKAEKDAKEKEKQKEGGGKGAGKGAGGGTSAPQDDLDQVVGSVEDDIGDIIAQTREHELLYGEDSLLKIFGGMCVEVCAHPKLYKNEVLRKAAVLSFSKFMCVSAQFCEDHLMMLFRVLETSSDPTVRGNIVIALGDIAVCFSTIMDENSDRLYAGLGDKDLNVKKNTLMVLTHLILNGMIKVKGQLGEMAKCLEDEERRISDLAKLFFSELSAKDNAIYNNLPDIISHLSAGNHAVDEESFMRTMKFIFQYIEKEKQAASIVEKLCQRFRHASDSPRQWRDIAFCLSLLPFKSEASVKKLTEGLPFYQDKLHEDMVYKRFGEILGKIRVNKIATKTDADLTEFEAALEEHKKKGMEDKELEKRAAKKGKKAAAGKSKGKMARVDVEEDEEEEEEEKGKRPTKKDKKPPPPPARQTRATRGGRGKQVVEDDQEDESEEEEESEEEKKPARGRAAAAKARGRAKTRAAPVRGGRRKKASTPSEESSSSDSN